MKTVESLLNHEANTNAIDHDGGTALMYAALRGNILIYFKRKLKLGFFFVFNSGHKKTCELLIQNGADLNILNIVQQIALHWAILGGNLKS